MSRTPEASGPAAGGTQLEAPNVTSSKQFPTLDGLRQTSKDTEEINWLKNQIIELEIKIKTLETNLPGDSEVNHASDSDQVNSPSTSSDESGNVAAAEATSPISTERECQIPVGHGVRVSKYSPPRVILTDNGPEFNYSVLEQLAKLFNIKNFNIMPYQPASNGLVERLNKKDLDALRVTVTRASHKWDELMPIV
ncbi:uncharacterized protein [Procambarus clarkii]|uniref:uncharacterized protein n=1 Tax=Procambarus clarkii TaxID=6728 RepID=UPI003741FE0F